MSPLTRHVLPLLLVAAVVRITLGGVATFPNDDAYIALHSARHLTLAQDPSYPGASPLTGATSLLHVLVLAAALQAVPPLVALEAVAWIGAFFFLWGLARIAASQLDRPWPQAGIVVLGAVCASTPLQLAGGQETGLALAAVTWAVHWLTGDRPERRRLAWLAGLLPAVRPELGILAAAVLYGRFTTARDFWKRDLSIAAVCWAIEATVMFAAIGTPIPNTISAKQHFFAYYRDPVAVSLGVAVVMLARWCLQLGPLAIVMAVRPPTRALRYVAVSLALFVVAFTTGGAGAIDHNFYRYLHPLSVPLAVIGLLYLRPAARTRVLVLSLAWAAWWAPTRWTDYVKSKSVVQGQATIAAWLTGNARPGTVVMVHDAGYLSEFTAMSLVDLVGLKTPRAFALHRELTGPSGGARRAEAVHILACETSPEFYVAFSTWERLFGLTSGLEQHGWTLEPVVRHVVPLRDDTAVFTLYRIGRSPGCGPRRAATSLQPTVDSLRETARDLRRMGDNFPTTVPGIFSLSSVSR